MLKGRLTGGKPKEFPPSPYPARKKASGEVSPDILAERVSCLIEDNRMHKPYDLNIMVPLAMFAMLGAATV